MRIAQQRVHGVELPPEHHIILICFDRSQGWTQPALNRYGLADGRLFCHRNQIMETVFWPKPGITPGFGFIWDQDVVGAILHALRGAPAGIYNVAGDGALTIHQIAERMGKRCRVLSPGLLRSALWVGKRLGLTQYGPEQLRFLQYRPVLANQRLKDVFGYHPRKTSAEVFDFWWAARQRRARA